MSTTKQVAKNGQSNKQTAKKETSQESKKVLAKVDDILHPSPEGRIQKLENFKILAKRHNFLVDKKNDLDKFIISSDGTKEKVILKNAEGFEFEVSNSQVIEEVLQVVQNKLTQFIERSGKEVLAFSI